MSIVVASFVVWIVVFADDGIRDVPPSERLSVAECRAIAVDYDPVRLEPRGEELVDQWNEGGCQHVCGGTMGIIRAGPCD